QLQRAQLLVAVHEHLRVAGSPEPVPLQLEARPQVPLVVDLAVENDRDVAGLVEQRLVTGRGQVDDRQAAHADADAALDQLALVVGTAVTDAVGHRPDLLGAHGCAIEADDSGDAAHVQAAFAATSRYTAIVWSAAR